MPRSAAAPEGLRPSRNALCCGPEGSIFRRCTAENATKAMSDRAQIVIEGVSHLYRPPSGRAVLALEEVSLDVGVREFVALLGPSGCGKSTLLYLIGGFLPTEKGKILIEGKPVGAPGPDRGIVFQHC